MIQVSRRAKHGLAAAVSVVAGAGSGVLANLITNRWQPALGLALLALVAVMAALEAWLGMSSASASVKVAATGDGSVAIGGRNEGTVSTEVTSPIGSAQALETESGEISATGRGSVSLGGSNSSQIITKIKTLDSSISVKLPSAKRNRPGGVE